MGGNTSKKTTAAKQKNVSVKSSPKSRSGQLQKKDEPQESSQFVSFKHRWCSKQDIEAVLHVLAGEEKNDTWGAPPSGVSRQQIHKFLRGALKRVQHLRVITDEKSDTERAVKESNADELGTLTSMCLGLLGKKMTWSECADPHSHHPHGQALFKTLRELAIKESNALGCEVEKHFHSRLRTHFAEDVLHYRAVRADKVEEKEEPDAEAAVDTQSPKAKPKAKTKMPNDQNILMDHIRLLIQNPPRKSALRQDKFLPSPPWARAFIHRQAYTSMLLMCASALRQTFLDTCSKLASGVADGKSCEVIQAPALDLKKLLSLQRFSRVLVNASEPKAAALTDILRCTIVCETPAALRSVAAALIKNPCFGSPISVLNELSGEYKLPETARGMRRMVCNFVFTPRSREVPKPVVEQPKPTAKSRWQTSVSKAMKQKNESSPGSAAPAHSSLPRSVQYMMMGWGGGWRKQTVRVNPYDDPPEPEPEPEPKVVHTEVEELDEVNNYEADQDLGEWTECYDEEGNKYYYNSTTEESTWERPQTPVLPSPEPPALKDALWEEVLFWPANREMLERWYDRDEDSTDRSQSRKAIEWLEDVDMRSNTAQMVVEIQLLMRRHFQHAHHISLWKSIIESDGGYEVYKQFRASNVDPDHDV